MVGGWEGLFGNGPLSMKIQKIENFVKKKRPFKLIPFELSAGGAQ